jgi:hypothetical protein
MNKTFGRAFEIDRLKPEVLDGNEWLGELFSRWHPSGAIGGASGDHLRLAVRNGYLNFYRAGQSVANVGFSRGALRAKIHPKYVFGDDAVGQTYVTLTSAGFTDAEGNRSLYKSGHLAEWIKNASGKSGEEKRFVDSVIDHNPNIVDVEMGLPAYSEVRRAPRMDLVDIEPIGHRWQVVFWEAKLVGDGRARCSGDGLPKVVTEQMSDYVRWLSHENHRDLVADAYQRTCRLLVGLHAIAKGYRPDIEELGVGIRSLAADGSLPPLVDNQPRLLIDNRESDNTFVDNGHLEKLRTRGGLHVQMVNKPEVWALEKGA